jgi:hypothetical protein
MAELVPAVSLKSAIAKRRQSHFLDAQSQRKGAIAPCSWTPEEYQVESSEHQDNANIHCQPFPESVSEEREIYTDYDGCHRHHVKHESYLSAHFSQHSADVLARIIAFFCGPLKRWMPYTILLA